MDLEYVSGAPETPVLAALIDTLAAHAGVCAKLIDRGGEVVAVNARGAAMLGKSAGDICGRAWSGLWDPTTEKAAEDAVDAAFEGAPAQFTGRLAGDDQLRVVRALPLTGDGSGVKTVLTLTADGPAARTDPVTLALPAALHAFANLANVSASSSRLLGRGLDPEMTRQLAQDLGTAAQKATEALEELRALRSDAD